MNGVGLEIARTPRPLNCKGLVCVCFFYYPINTLLRVSRRALPTVIVTAGQCSCRFGRPLQCTGLTKHYPVGLQKSNVSTKVHRWLLVNSAIK